MKPTRERAIAALRAVLELCDEIDVIPPFTDHERGLVRMSRLARTAIETTLAADPTTSTTPRS